MSDVEPTTFAARQVAAQVVSGLPNERTGGEPRTVALHLLQHAGRRLERRGMTARFFEERVRERERIARELHDTLLQGTQALLLSVHALSNRLQPDDPMHGMLTDTLRRADAVMAQGRDRIQNLRSTTVATADLVQALEGAWSDLCGRGEFRILHDGPSRELEPDARDEISLIGREALTNALRHSKAKVIEAQIVFGDDELRLHVRDDGVGFGREVVGTDALAGHWGLLGMHERARRISATLSIWSAPGAGTEIELTVPAAFAYRGHAASRRSPGLTGLWVRLCDAAKRLRGGDLVRLRDQHGK